jgi:hypothetical protein
LYKQSIYPIEETIHDFSVELLKGFESAFILDNRKEVERLKEEVAKAIQAIQSSNNEEANAILARQIQKLKSIENITSASEGVVFEFEGNVYKFTANFAPINQILGLFKYGRGKIPPMEKLDELEKDYGANYNIHDLFMGLDSYLILKEELGIDVDKSFNKYKGYEIVVDTEDESATPRFISKAL